VLGVTDLDSCLAEIKSHGEFLPGEDVRVLGLLEGPFQLVQLVGGEGGAAAADLARLVHVVGVVGAAVAQVAAHHPVRPFVAAVLSVPGGRRPALQTTRVSVCKNIKSSTDYILAIFKCKIYLKGKSKTFPREFVNFLIHRNKKNSS